MKTRLIAIAIILTFGALRLNFEQRLTEEHERAHFRGAKLNLDMRQRLGQMGFLAALSGFRPVLTMSWGYDLVMDADKSAWMQWVTRYTLKRSVFFTSDANVPREKAITYGMHTEHTVVFPWGVDLEYFLPKKEESVALPKVSKGAKQATVTNRKSKTLAPGARAGVANPKSVNGFGH